MKKNEEKALSFLSFLKSKDQRTDWLIMAISCIIGFIIIKVCYPYPATISDSATYVHAAAENMFTFYRPFGYSYFLRIVHALSASIHAVFVVQMLIYFLATALFAFVVKYIFPPRITLLWRVLIFIFAFSPIAFYMANALMSDLLFASMVYIMLAAFIYLVRKQSWAALIFFLLSLFFALHIRYSAMMFPLPFIGLLFMVKGKMRWIGMAGVVLMTFTFYNQVKTSMRKATGFDQFSTGFDGWQIANNALHIVPYIDLQPAQIKDKQMASLHEYMLSQKDVIAQRTDNGKKVVASFMWINDLPLKQYLGFFIQHNKEPYPICWIYLGSNNYKDYGQYLITHYPIEFMQYYYLPNAVSVVYPDSKEIIGSYSPIGSKDILEWYKVPEKSNIDARYNPYESFVAEWSCLSYIAIWLVILTLTLLSVIFRKKLKWEAFQQQTFWIIAATGLIYYAATVFASPVSLRFWIPANAALFGITYIMANRLAAYWNENRKTKETKK